MRALVALIVASAIPVFSAALEPGADFDAVVVAPQTLNRDASNDGLPDDWNV